jgi:uncharacterized protein
MSKFTVIKYDAHEVEKLHYTGQVVRRNRSEVVIQARFTKPDMEFFGIPFKKDDLFYETYFHNRWYNIDEIYDRDDGRLKGWYCNIAYPPRITRWGVSYIDLALDLLVYPDGKTLILDEDEFEELHLPQETSQKALDGLHELQKIFNYPSDFRLRKDLMVRQKVA